MSIKKSLVLTNIVNSALIDWFDDFKAFNLIETDTMYSMSSIGNSLTMNAFSKLEN